MNVKRKNESGRSMVEMLGTLAIVGVLSIGGIAGYSYGMDKYRANETINDVNMRGIDLVRQVAMNQPLSLSEWPTVSKAGYTISEADLSVEGDAYFSISGVPKRVCELVYQGIQNNQTTDVEVNGYVVDDSSACGDDNKMGFFFITNAGEGGTNPEDLCKDKTCPEGFSCTHGICTSDKAPEYISGEIVCKTGNDCSTDGCQYCSERCYPTPDGTPCADGQGVCHQGSCVKNGCENGCADDEYCGDTNEDQCSPTPYKCKKLNFSKIEISQGTVYLSRQNMSYWDARSACSALGAKLINQTTMNELYNDIRSKIYGVQEAWWLSETQNCQAYSGATYFQLKSKNSKDYVSALCFDDGSDWIESQPQTEALTPEETPTTTEETTSITSTETVVVYNTEPYSARIGCTSNADCGECSYCRTNSSNDTECVAYLQSDNMPCDSGRGLCTDRGGNQAVCVIPETCSTNSDCDRYGSDYYCGMVTHDATSLEVTNNYQCTKLNFVNYKINGYDVFISTRTILAGYGEFYNSTSAQNACSRMGMNVVNPTVLCKNYTPSGWQDGLCYGAYIVCSKEVIQ